MSTGKTKKKLLIGLAECYGKNFSENALEIMLDALDDVSEEEFQIATKRAQRKSKWMPTVAQLRQIVKRHRFNVGEKIIPEIRRRLEKVGEYQIGEQTWQEDVDRVLAEMGYSEGYVDSNRV